MINRAKRFAIEAHGDQTYGDLPYCVHLAAVETVVVEFFGIDEMELRIAAWLHDTLEDTPVKYDDIVAVFGEDIADIVEAVTNEPGSRKERAEATYAKIRQNYKAISLKLCDRIANVLAGGKVDMYRKEYEGFRKALYTPGIHDDLWEYLHELLLYTPTDDKL